MKKRIIITGGSGQLGQCLHQITSDFPAYEYYFLDRSDCDITSRSSVIRTFESLKPEFVINAAAYTAVDAAETNTDEAYNINAYALRNIAQQLGEARCIHLSTDYVYNSINGTSLKESDPTLPVGVYAKSKLLGEEILMSSPAHAMIIRTSWLYSEYGHNFLKTMIKLSNERNSLSVVNDQIGSPTYCMDLALIIMNIIDHYADGLIPDNLWDNVYNYANHGMISWYDFACEIFKIKGINIDLKAIPSVLYPTPAHRPSWSVLDTTKINQAFGIEIIDWKVSLEKCMANLVN